ncbi:MAG: methionine synthase [Nakamurella sp.]
MSTATEPPVAERTATAGRSLRWPVAAATGLGVMPGHDVAEVLRAVVGEVPELPFLPQLPDRGVGADAAGRTIGLLVDIWADVVPSGWRVSRRPSRDGHRGQDLLDRDLDALEEHAAAAETVKLQVLGPWTLGALLETSAGNRMLTDPGAMNDLIGSLAEGVATHVADVRRRLPRATVMLQLDEYLLPAVLDGALRTASGLTMVRAVDVAVVRDGLREVLAAAPDTLTAANAGRRRPPLELLAQSGFAAVRVDFTTLGRTAILLDPVGEALRRVTGVLAGVVPTAASERAPGRPDGPVPLAERARPITEPLRALGFSPATIATQVIPTPAGPLDGVSVEDAVDALRSSREIARLLAEGADPDLAGTDLERETR